MPSTTSGLKRSTMRRPARSAAGRTAGSARFFHHASRSRPCTLIVASSKPASGTRRSSGPPARPTSSTSPDGSWALAPPGWAELNSARSARATASAGNRCPPVPPPAIKRRIFPLSRVRVGPCRALAGDAQQHADRSQRAGQRRASVTEERQRHAGHRERVGDGGHVEQRLEGDPGGDRGGERDAERVRRPHRSAVSAPGEEEKSEHHESGADEARLLADDREDEVGVGFGQPAVLLYRVPDADPEESARGEAVDRLRRLESG